MKNLSLFITSCALLFSTNSIAGSFLLEEYNLVTIEDVSAQSLHIHGQTLVGGDINQSNSLEFGQRLDQNDASVIALEVGGEVSANTIKAFSTVIADNTNNAVGSINNERNGDVTYDDLSDLSATIEENLTSASTGFNNLEANSSFVEVRDDVTGISFDESLGATDYAVLNVDYDAVFGNNQNHQLEILANTTNSVEGIIINVSGTNIGNFNFIGANANSTTNVLYNFYEATTISLSRQFFGSILAPLATLTSSNDVEGSVGVLSIGSSFSGELHDFLTTVSAPETTDTPDTPSGATEVPEPLTWVLFISFALITYQLRHRKKI